MTALFVTAAILWALWALDLLNSLYRLTSPLHPAAHTAISKGPLMTDLDIHDDQPLAYIKDSQGESPLPIDHIEDHPAPRELIVEGGWVTLRLPQEKE